MTNETEQSNPTDIKTIPFGNRLKSARESLGFDRKDVAAQLRLNEKIIVMMEKDRYPADLPVTFIRGYLRAYGKLLQIPDYEIKKAIEPIKPKPNLLSAAPTSFTTPPPVTSGNYFMQFFTYLIVFTLIGLVGMWWYSHSTGMGPMLSENTVSAPSPDHAALAMNTQNESPLPPPEATPAAAADATPAAPLDSGLMANATPTPAQNNVDTSAKITNDTDVVSAAPKVATRKPAKAKRVVPVVEAEAQDLDPSRDGRDYTETNSD